MCVCVYASVCDLYTLSRTHSQSMPMNLSKIFCNDLWFYTKVTFSKKKERKKDELQTSASINADKLLMDPFYPNDTLESPTCPAEPLNFE